MRRRRETRGAVLAGVALTGLMGACASLAGGEQRPLPLITRFEVFMNPQHPGKGPFELLAHASGEGVLQFHWEATGGWLSVASASASASGLVPAFSAWQPPSEPGLYEVRLTVSDGRGMASRRRARFEVTSPFTRILEPRPAQLPSGGFPLPGGEGSRGPAMSTM